MITLLEPSPEALARAWLAVDPDPETRVETEQLLTGDPHALAARFTKQLRFGTAGLRGPLGAGPTRMNRVLVRVVAHALSSLLPDLADQQVVVGYDARHKSRVFAEDTARVLASNGVACVLFPHPVPTPVTAFAVRHLEATAGVMVTASHNPAQDNGYKIYWQGGNQLMDSIAEQLSTRIENIALAETPITTTLDHPLISVANSTVEDAYVDAIIGLLHPSRSRTARIAYSPIHGVGASTLCRAFHQAGFPDPDIAPEQAAPDPDFPTAPMPNPEEPGVLEPLLRLASKINADVALANDPDADRLAVAVPSGRTWRLLSGDELGCLLADYLLRQPYSANRRRLVVNTIVSSQLLARIAAGYDADHVQTLTGFKWLMQAGQDRPQHQHVLAYEEALGYSIGDVVGDKDGISAALVVAELVSHLAADSRSLLDLLDDLHRVHGVHMSGQRSARFEVNPDGESIMDTAMARLRRSPPAVLAGLSVTQVVDLAAGSGDLPPTDALLLRFGNTQVIFRPSGTEPKLKVYAEVVIPVDHDLAPARDEAHSLLQALLTDAVAAAVNVEQPAEDPGATDPTERAMTPATTIPSGFDRSRDLRLIVRCIDLTTLEGSDTSARIRSLCATARRPDSADPTVGPVAAVCVYPTFVGLVRQLTSGSSVRVASVAGAFPSGLSLPAVRLADITSAVDAGADEVDIVLNRSAFLDGRLDDVVDELRQAREATESVHLKVILEVGELVSETSIKRAAKLAMEAGADMIKTSTGKSSIGADPRSVLVMAESIRDHHRRTGRLVGLKIAGGVRTAEQGLRYISIIRQVLGEEWLTPDLLRFGASSLLENVVTELRATEMRLR